MALKSGRVGVNPKEVTSTGKIKKRFPIPAYSATDKGKILTAKADGTTEWAYRHEDIEKYLPVGTVALPSTIPTGSAEIKKIVGNTVKWNQLANNSTVPTARDGLTFTANSDGTFTVNGTATALVSAVGWFGMDNSSGRSGHKILQSMKLVSGTVSGTASFRYAQAYCSSVELGNDAIVTLTGGDATSSGNSSFSCTNNTVFANAKIRIQVIDLTAIFGLGNEPSTVEEFKALFPADYYPYDAGSLQSFEGDTLNDSPLPTMDYFPTGMKKVGTVSDELVKDKATQKIGERDYAEGDENDPDVLTDLTTTYYVLDTPVETPISPALDLTYPVTAGGNETLESDSPVGTDMVIDYPIMTL